MNTHSLIMAGVNAFLGVAVAALGALLVIKLLRYVWGRARAAYRVRYLSVVATRRRERAARLIINYVPDARDVFERGKEHFLERAGATTIAGEKVFWREAAADVDKILELVPQRRHAARVGCSAAGAA